MALYPKKNAPWRRVTRTVRIAEGQFYDELECGHREAHDCEAKKRRCRTCADPTFPGISIEPRSPSPSTVEKPVLEAPSSGDPLGIASEGSPPAIPLVMTVAEVAKLLRVNVKTVYAAAASGEIPGGRKIGRILRFYGPAVAKWLESGPGTQPRKTSRRPQR